MADEVSEAFNVSYDLLHADAQLEALVGDRIYQHFVPPGTTALHILGDYLAGTDVNGVGGARLMTNPLMLWRVIRKGQVDANTQQAAERMDVVLSTVRAEISGGYVFSIERESPYRRPYHDDANNLWIEVGGRYRYYISEA